MARSRLLLALATAALLVPSARGAGAADEVAKPRLTLCLAAAADGSPVYPLKEVPSNHREIAVVFQLRDDETVKTMSHVWTAVDVGEAAPAGTVIAEGKLDVQGQHTGVLRFTLPRDLPVGKYTLEVKADDKAWSALELKVGEALKVTPVEKPADLLPLAVGTKWGYALVLEAGPIVKNVTLPGTEKGADGKLRGPVTFTAAAPDDHGTRVEMRRGGVVANEEWWRLDATGLAVTKERQGTEEAEYDPPVYTIRLPLEAPSSWEHKSKDGSFQRSCRMWGPLPVAGPAGDVPGYVILSTQPTDRGAITIERHFAPGIGVVREVHVQTAVGKLLTRLETTIVPVK